MKALLTKVSDVVKALIGTETIGQVTAEKTFDDPIGGKSVLRYYSWRLPKKRETTEQEEDFPFCLVTPGEFSFTRDGRLQKVDVIFGLYEAGSEADGLTMIDTFMALIATAPAEIFTPYKLMGNFTGSAVGEHPYYQLTLTGEFRKAK